MIGEISRRYLPDPRDAHPGRQITPHPPGHTWTAAHRREGGVRPAHEQWVRAQAGALMLRPRWSRSRAKRFRWSTRRRAVRATIPLQQRPNYLSIAAKLDFSESSTRRISSTEHGGLQNDNR